MAMSQLLKHPLVLKLNNVYVNSLCMTQIYLMALLLLYL